MPNATATARPLIVAKVAATQPTAWRDVLCVVNLDGTDSQLIQTASDAAAPSGARLHLVHVVPEVSEGLLAWSLAHAGRPLSESLARQRILEQASSLPAIYSASVYSGSDQRQLARAARATSADLVVLDADHPNLRRLLKRLDCPVLAVRAGSPQRTAPEATHALEAEYAVKPQ
jgi:nucleotide-binding universal stress UspA family protein